MAVVSGFQLATYLTYAGMPTTTLMPATAALTDQDPTECFMKTFQGSTSGGGTVGYPIG